MRHSLHHGKIAKDPDSRLWSGHCDCGLVWDQHHWNATFSSVVTHVENARKVESFGGMGFSR